MFPEAYFVESGCCIMKEKKRVHPLFGELLLIIGLFLGGRGELLLFLYKITRKKRN